MEKYTFVLASSNKNKIREFREILCERASELLGVEAPEIEILSLYDIGFTEEIIEDGATFEENAMIKAHAVAKVTHYPCIADDSGLEVDALNGAPGIYSARYAGEHGNDKANNALLLENLADKADRSASFVCAIACVLPDELERGHYFRGETEGIIIDEYRGEGGFGYDPLFLYEPMGKTFAELSGEEKNAISHRGKAIELFAEYLKALK